MASPPPLLLGALALVSSFAAWPVHQNGSAAPTEQPLTAGVLLPERNLRSPWAWPRVAPALRLALEALEPGLRHTGLALRTAFASTEDGSGACSEDAARDNLIDLKANHNPDVLLGPGCDIVSRSAEELASRWGLPLLTAGIFAPRVTDKKELSTTVYVGPAGAALSAFLARLHRGFDWTSRAALLFRTDIDTTVGYWLHRASFVRAVDRGAPATFSAPDHQYGRPDEALQFIQASGRVVHIYGPVEMFHEIMCWVQGHNLTTGDYVFLYVDLFGLSLRPEVAAKPCETAKPWQSQDPRGLQEALQSVLVVTAHEPQTPEYRRFQSQLILRAQRDFGVELNESLENLVAGCFHDGLLLYAMALNETLHEGGTKKDTRRILDKMRGRKFPGVTGMVSINSDGEREMDFDLWSVAHVESGEFQVVGHYVGSEKRVKWLRPIRWKKGRPPLDNPPCVFDKDDPSCGGTDSCFPPFTRTRRLCSPRSSQSEQIYREQNGQAD